MKRLPGNAFAADRCDDDLRGMSVTAWEGTAYTLFGVPVARALVTCDGSMVNLAAG